MIKKNSGRGRSDRQEKSRDGRSPRREDRSAAPKRSFVKRDDKPAGPKKEFSKDDERKPRRDDRPAPAERPYERKERSFDRKDDRPKREFVKREDRSSDSKKFYTPERFNETAGGDRKDKKPSPKKRFSKPKGEKDFFEKKKTFTPGSDEKKRFTPRPEKRFFRGKQKTPPTPQSINRKSEVAEEPQSTGDIRLNRFIANAGICSRREADDYIAAGVVTVNGVVITQMGVRVSPADVIKFHDRVISGERKVYVVLNKPKDYITTTDDPLERKTVMALLEDTGKERIYPVGRLDRATTGVLLFTNDGDLTKKLTHPAHKIKKTYLVELDKPLTKADFEKLLTGVELEDGPATVDAAAYFGDGKDKKQLLVELHSGRNRIVRRIFEGLGYQVVKLDRTAFAGITKKDLMRGRWRFLTEKEIGYLKMQGGLI